MKLTRYLAADENGDVFIFTEKPTRRNIEGFWSCKGEEDPIFKEGLMTSFGRILGLDKYHHIWDNLTWEDEPIEIEIDI